MSDKFKKGDEVYFYKDIQRYLLYGNIDNIELYKIYNITGGSIFLNDVWAVQDFELIQKSNLIDYIKNIIKIQIKNFNKINHNK